MGTSQSQLCFEQNCIGEVELVLHYYYKITYVESYCLLSVLLS